MGNALKHGQDGMKGASEKLNENSNQVKYL
jgi:uncharacterized protein YkvS